MNWYLKKSSGEVYGPAELSDVQRWAMDGRISREDLISQDQASWRPAHEMPELGMNWMVETADNEFYGPVHLMAFRDYIRTQTITDQTVVFHKDTKVRRRVSEILTKAILDDNAAMQTQLEALTARLQEAERELIDHQTRVPANTGLAPGQAPKPGDQDSFQLERDAQKWKRMYDDERESSRRKEELLGERIRQIQQSEANTQAGFTIAQRKLQQAEKNLDLLQKSITESSDPDNLLSQITGVMAAYDTLAETNDQMIKQLSSKSIEIRMLRESQAATEIRMRERVQDAEQQLKLKNEEVDLAQKKLQEIEESHTMLLHQYRQMNDRFIRLYQSKAPAVPDAAATKPNPKAASSSRISLTRAS